MLMDDILREAGIPGRETLYIDAPGGCYVSWGDEITADGSDFCNELYTHRYTAYLFQPRDAADDSAREALQSVLDDNGIHFTRQARIFYEDLQYFCTTYIFEVVERRLI